MSWGVEVRKRNFKVRTTIISGMAKLRWKRAGKDNEASMDKAVCLLSGGLDSATCLALARRDGYACYALSFDYGQRHKIELEAAGRGCASIGGEKHLRAKIGLDAFGGSALTDDIAVPKARSAEQMGDGIPVTYVPARNTIFLSFALA